MLGLKLGMFVGLLLGKPLGAKLGLFEGIFDGDIDGTSLGDRLGTGAGVGSFCGDGVLKLLPVGETKTPSVGLLLPGFGSVSKKSTNKALTKNCQACGRPFNWRRKWKRCWDEVKYCSHKCRSRKLKAEQSPE